MATQVDISMFNTDALKLTLFYSLLKKSTSNSNFITPDMDLNHHYLTLMSIKRGYIDYYNGRVFKSDISGPIFETGLYNRDNGTGAAERIVQEIRTELGI